MDTRLETEEQRMVRELREWAEDAVQRLENALAVAGLPVLPSLSAGRITITPDGGVHVQLGGCSPRALFRLADWIEAHARCAGRIVPSAAVSGRVVQLPVLQSEVRAGDEQS
jgi:hypothetical protein